MVMMLMMLIVCLYSALFVARETFFAYSMIYCSSSAISSLLPPTTSVAPSISAWWATPLRPFCCTGIIVAEQLFIGVIFTAESLGR